MHGEPTQTGPLFKSLNIVANRLGVARKWLKAEALAGRVPFILVGKKMLLHLAQVEQTLIEQSKANVKRESPAAQVPIPVSERLPEQYKEVLIWRIDREGGIWAVDFLDGKRWAQNYRDHEVTHWMPLPPPPTQATARAESSLSER